MSGGSHPGRWEVKSTSISLPSWLLQQAPQQGRQFDSGEWRYWGVGISLTTTPCQIHPCDPSLAHFSVLLCHFTAQQTRGVGEMLGQRCRRWTNAAQHSANALCLLTVTTYSSAFESKTFAGCWANVVDVGPRRWTSIKPALGQGPLFDRAGPLRAFICVRFDYLILNALCRCGL